jgi:hypothetical protein
MRDEAQGGGGQIAQRPVRIGRRGQQRPPDIGERGQQRPPDIGERGE